MLRRPNAPSRQGSRRANRSQAPHKPLMDQRLSALVLTLASLPGIMRLDFSDLGKNVGLVLRAVRLISVSRRYAVVRTTPRYGPMPADHVFFHMALSCKKPPDGTF